MTEEKEGKGFVIRDRRIFSKDREGEREVKTEPSKETSEKEEAQKRQESQQQEQKTPPLPEVNFLTFVFSLSSSALSHLGEVPDPVSGEKKQDLPLAKQTIDILGMLEEKTKGNLTEEEASFLKSVLYDLRLRFVQKKGKG